MILHIEAVDALLAIVEDECNNRSAINWDQLDEDTLEELREALGERLDNALIGIIAAELGSR